MAGLGWVGLTLENELADGTNSRTNTQEPGVGFWALLFIILLISALHWDFNFHAIGVYFLFFSMNQKDYILSPCFQIYHPDPETLQTHLAVIIHHRAITIVSVVAVPSRLPPNRYLLPRVIQLQLTVITPLLRKRWSRNKILFILTFPVPLSLKLEEAVDRFGDYLFVDCTNLQCVHGHNQFKTKNSPDLTPKFRSLLSIKAAGEVSLHIVVEG